MGQLSLPAITKVEEVLDLLLDPKKYQDYLVEFKRVHNEVSLALGTLKTKQQADALLATAIDTKSQASAFLQAAQTETTKLRADAEAFKQDIDAFNEKSRQDHEARITDIRAQMSDLVQAQTAFDKDTKEVTTQQVIRKQTLDTLQTKLETLQKQLETKQTALAAAMQTLQ